MELGFGLAMKLLKKLNFNHALIGMNLFLLSFGMWSLAKPTKSWDVSKSSESRFIASAKTPPLEESFSKMKSIEVDCSNMKAQTSAKYIRLNLAACKEKSIKVNKITNHTTGTEASLLSSSKHSSTEFFYLEEGENRILLDVNSSESVELLVVLDTNFGN